MWSNVIQVKELIVETRRKIYTYYYLEYSERFLTLEINYIDKYLSLKKMFYSEVAKKNNAFYKEGDWYFENKEDAYDTKNELVTLLQGIAPYKNVI